MNLSTFVATYAKKKKFARLSIRCSAKGCDQYVDGLKTSLQRNILKNGTLRCKYCCRGMRPERSGYLYVRCPFCSERRLVKAGSYYGPPEPPFTQNCLHHGIMVERAQKLGLEFCSDETFREDEKRLILRALDESGWRRKLTARRLRISERTLCTRMHEHGLIENRHSLS